jgi:hypothetical protein
MTILQRLEMLQEELTRIIVDYEEELAGQQDEVVELGRERED